MNEKKGKNPWGACTNHVDRIMGNFDPPSPYVDTFTTGCTSEEYALEFFKILSLYSGYRVK